MPVTLENRQRKMRTYNLEHAAHRKTLKFISTALDKRGQSVLVRKVKSLGDSLTLTARGTPGSIVTGLPDTILNCREIAAAVERGDLRKKRSN